jgi:hypothetical protein
MTERKNPEEQSNVVDLLGRPYRPMARLRTLFWADPTVRHMIRRGEPLTRARYLWYLDQTEDSMTTELEANVPEQFQLMEDGSQPPEVKLFPGDRR